MKAKLRSQARHFLAGSLAWIIAQTASAHVTYTGRDFGSFTGNGNEAPVSISIGNVSSNFGWADAADADFGDSHRTRAFRFTLTHAATVTLRVTGTAVGAAAALQYPAFSLYSGLAHIAPDLADHDATPVTINYLNTLGGIQPKEGALVALGNWKIGNDDVYNTPGEPASGVSIPATLSSLTYVGHAADGTPINFGTAPSIRGDGLPDGDVTGTFLLPAGDYSVFIGGADYKASIDAVAPYTNYGVTATLTVAAPPDAIVKGGACSAFPDATFSAIHPPATNGQGTLALRAKVKAAGISSYIIGRRTTRVAAVAQSGVLAADTTGNWKSFGDPVINEAGEVAFGGTLARNTGGVLPTNDYGIWSDLGGTLNLVLREGDAAPGAPTGHLFTKASWFNIQEGALYIAAATYDGTTKRSGVWKWDGSTLSKVVMIGDTIMLSDGIGHRVTSVSKPSSSGNGNSTSRMVGSDGTLALLLKVADGRVEVVTFR